ncbi:MAG: serine hydrolase [Roseibacillus sp.]
MISATICLSHRLIAPLLLLLSLISAPAKEAFFVVEANSGRILMAQGALERKPVASLTKVATAMVVLDWAQATKSDLGTVIGVPASGGTLGGSNPMGLRVGDRITVRNALYSALLGSDNASAETLASHVGGAILHARGKNGDPVKVFVREMNELAKALGMRKTKFANAHGMDNGRQRGYSTATDIARLCIYAMRNPGFVFFVKQKSRKVSFQQAGQARGFTVQNTNKLLGQHNINGIKTGMTALAGQCLATSSELKPIVQKLPDGRSSLRPRRLICVVLGSEDRFARTQVLVKQGWEFYDQWVKEGALIRDPAKETLTVPNPR